MEVRTRPCRQALPLALAAWLACAPCAASAADGAFDLFSAETVEIDGDLRAVAVDGERSWADGGFGKLRYGGGGEGRRSALAAKPEFGEASLAWQPRLGWSLAGTVVALAQGRGGHEPQAGLSEAYLTFKPLGGGPVKLSARAGLMWPPVSLEHGGPAWLTNDTITPSAIASWMGEEVKAVGIEATAKGRLGSHELAATIAGFDVNDTAGALLALRGWALHDRKALAFRKQPLPELNDFIEYVQPRYSHPLLDVGGGFRPGYYGKLAWTAPVPLHVEVLHYDNNADPLAVNADLEWGWRTKFDALGLVADLGGGRELRTQGLRGRTRMGDKIGGSDWIDMRFRAAYAMVTQRFRGGSASARLDLFGTRNQGSAVDLADDEDGWAVTLAAKRALGANFTAFIEYLHVESDRAARMREMLAPRQAQNQVQAVLRAHW